MNKITCCEKCIPTEDVAYQCRNTMCHCHWQNASTQTDSMKEDWKSSLRINLTDLHLDPIVIDQIEDLFSSELTRRKEGMRKEVEAKKKYKDDASVPWFQFSGEAQEKLRIMRDNYNAGIDQAIKIIEEGME